MDSQPLEFPIFSHAWTDAVLLQLYTFSSQPLSSAVLPPPHFYLLPRFDDMIRYELTGRRGSFLLFTSSLPSFSVIVTYTPLYVRTGRFLTNKYHEPKPFKEASVKRFMCLQSLSNVFEINLDGLIWVTFM